MRKSLVIVLFLFILVTPLSAMAGRLFNPDFIITDDELTDYGSLDLADIQKFLIEHGSSLGNSYFKDFHGQLRWASEIIHRAALAHQISPKVILTVLQKEQSLIESASPSKHNLDWATGYALCDSCSSSNPDLADFIGFGKQVHYLGAINRKYINNPLAYNYAVGRASRVDGSFISPVNQATANLYNYTPHISGNQSFWRLWQRYWERTHPDGTLIKTTSSPAVWFIQHGLRRPINSYTVLLSRFNPDKILVVEESDLDKYEEGQPLKFPNYSLLREPEGGIFLLVDDTLRPIVSMEAFRNIGFSVEEIIPVEKDEVYTHRIGTPITLESIYPSGTVVRNVEDTILYYVQENVKRIILSPEILESNFPNSVVSSVRADEIERYDSGSPVLFKDGELVMAEGGIDVYVISGSRRRPIASEQAFLALGYDWSSILVTSQEALELHALGPVIE